MKIVNPHLAQNIHEQGMIVPPNEFGYIHLAGEIETPFILKKDSHQKKQLIRKLKNLCNELDNTTDVIRRTDIFTAIIVPPGSGDGRKFREEKELDFHVATFDLVILIECKKVQDIDQILDCKLYKIIENLLSSNSTCFNRTLAKNSNRIAEVDKDKQGIFLFNYFFAEDSQTVLDVWEYTAGWWTANANLTNSTPLLPLTNDNQYSLINHCRWDHLIDIMPALILGRLGIKSGLNDFVLKNFTENNIVAMPVLYQLV